MIEVHSRSAEETRSLAARIAGLARPGDVIVLSGELGAGKTVFTQGFGAALGVTERITSPTFTLANLYRGRMEVNHLDVYRLGQLEEVMDLSLPELIDGDGVTIIEWGDAILPALPTSYLEVQLLYGEGDDDRIIRLRPSGGHSAREAELAAAVEAWEEAGRC